MPMRPQRALQEPKTLTNQTRAPKRPQAQCQSQGDIGRIECDQSTGTDLKQKCIGAKVRVKALAKPPEVFKNPVQRMVRWHTRAAP